MSVQNTAANKARRMAKHAVRYAHKDPRPASVRRAIGRTWKAEALRRKEFAKA